MIFLGPEDTWETWSASQKSHKGDHKGGGRAQGVGRALDLVGPSVTP